jgi:hypothetical protein
MAHLQMEADHKRHASEHPASSSAPLLPAGAYAQVPFAEGLSASWLTCDVELDVPALPALPAHGGSFSSVLQSCKQAHAASSRLDGGCRHEDKEQPQQLLLPPQQQANLLAALTGIDSLAKHVDQPTGQHADPAPSRPAASAHTIPGSTILPAALPEASCQDPPLLPPASLSRLLRQLPPLLDALKLDLPVLPTAPGGPTTLDLILSTTTARLQASAKLLFTKPGLPLAGPTAEDLLAADYRTADDDGILLPVPRMQDADRGVVESRSNCLKATIQACGCRPTSVAHLELYLDWSLIAPVPQHRAGSLLPFPCCEELEQLVAGMIGGPACSISDAAASRMPESLVSTLPPGSWKPEMALPARLQGVGGWGEESREELPEEVVRVMALLRARVEMQEGACGSEGGQRLKAVPVLPSGLCANTKDQPPSSHTPVVKYQGQAPAHGFNLRSHMQCTAFCVFVHAVHFMHVLK